MFKRLTPAASFRRPTNANDWTARLPAIAAAVERIKAKSFTIDGEAVVLGPDGLSPFEDLRRREAWCARMATRAWPASLCSPNRALTPSCPIWWLASAPLVSACPTSAVTRRHWLQARRQSISKDASPIPTRMHPCQIWRELWQRKAGRFRKQNDTLTRLVRSAKHWRSSRHLSKGMHGPSLISRVLLQEITPLRAKKLGSCLTLH